MGGTSEVKAPGFGAPESTIEGHHLELRNGRASAFRAYVLMFFARIQGLGLEKGFCACFLRHHPWLALLA